MELTVISKKRFEQLNDAIKNLENQINMANIQLKAIQDSNNQLAEIAFDEARFTDVILDKVDETAREAARDCIDIDEIANQAAGEIDVSDAVESYAERYGLLTSDSLNDTLDSKGYLEESEVETLIEQYIDYNCDFVDKSDLHDYMDSKEIEERLDEIKEEIVEELVDKVVAAIVNKLTGKENTNAQDNRDSGIHISGVIAQGATGSNGEAHPA